MPTACQIFNAASSQTPSDTLAAIGLPRPKTYLDVWLAMNSAYDAMTPQEKRAEDTETRVRLNYIASASKAPGAQPKMPDARYTKDPNDDA